MSILDEILKIKIIFILSAIVIGGIFFINHIAVAATGVIVAPADNSAIKNGAVLAVQTKDNNSGVSGVSFYYYDAAANPIGNEVTSGDNGVYAVNWNDNFLSDGQYLIFAAIHDQTGSTSVTEPISVSLDNLPPVITSVEAIDQQTIQITFNDSLQKINSALSDFAIYRRNGEEAVGISFLNSLVNVLTLTLVEPLKTSDSPTFWINAGAIADLAGNKTAGNLSGAIKEKINPTIILKGESMVSINPGAIYHDAGAVCTDFAGDNPTLSIIGGVNTKAAGIYVLLYNCADAAGNQAVQAQRTVIVKTLSSSSSYNDCQNIVYSEWGSCFNGLQYRNILSTDPGHCLLSAEQQADRSRFCSGQVLGVQIYAIGSLIRTPDKKIFLVLGNNQVQKIRDLKELAKYKNRKIFNITYELFAQFKQVLGIKIYADGTLLRGPDKRIYRIVSGKKYYISSLNELAKYKNTKIYNVSAEVVGSY
jgi:hypothetical protein